MLSFEWNKSLNAVRAIGSLSLLWAVTLFCMTDLAAGTPFILRGRFLLDALSLEQAVVGIFYGLHSSAAHVE